jgi:ligand-binding sensor domain-containing protein
MWIGTATGLSRFDGSRFQNFYYNPTDTNSLPNNEVLCIMQDHAGLLWFGTRYGVAYYTPHTGKIKRFHFSTSYDYNRHWTGAMIEDGEHNIWLGHNRGMGYINPQRTGYIPVSFKPTEYILTNEDFPVRCFALDEQNTLWVGTQYKGLHKILNKQPVYIPFAKGMIRNTQECISIDNEGKIWTGTWSSGIYMYNPATNTWKQLMPVADKRQEDGINNIVRGVKINTINGRKKILVATFTNGVFDLDESSGVFTQIHPSYRFKDVENKFGAMSQSAANVFWLASATGLYKTVPYNTALSNYSIQSLYAGSETPPEVTKIVSRQKAGGLWLSTQWLGTFDYDIHKKTGIRYNSFGLPGINNNEYVYTYTQDKTGNTWLAATYGLYVLPAGSTRAKLILHNQAPANQQSIGSCYKSFFDSHGTLWIACDKGVFYCTTSGINTKATDFIPLYHVSQEKELGFSAATEDITEDKQGRLWFTRSKPHHDLPGGISCYNPAGQTFIHYHHDGKGANLASQLSVNQLAISPSGILYVKTYKGVLHANTNDPKPVFEELMPANRVPLNNMLEMVCDSMDNLWIMNESQLLFLNEKTKRQELFTEKDGLPPHKTGLGLIGKDTLAIGYTAGFALVSINQLLQQKPSPKIVLTGLDIFNQPYADSTKAFSFVNNIKLGHKQNTLQFYFSLLDYIGGSQVSYRYRLAGLNNDWVDNGDKSTVSFSNLPPGKYTFKVKGTADGVNWSNAVSVDVFIKPPFWKTNWFKIAAVLAASLIAYAVYRRRIATIRKNALLKQQRTEAELKALRSQMNPHFIFNCMNTIDAFILKNKRSEASEILQQFSLLTRSILENAREETISLHKEAATLENYIALEQTVMEHKFNYRFIVSEELLHQDYYIPTMLLQPYIENAIVHGLKYIDGKEGLLEVTLVKDNNYLQCTVSDNGIGREASAAKQAGRTGKHKSYGMKVTAERIAAINTGSNRKIIVTITDLAQGTRVGLYIPLIEGW